jgi:short-subunit dehydrogenase
MKPLTGKVVLITGASRGLGIDMARAFAGRGARLVLAARSLDDLEAVRASLRAEAPGVEALTVATDVQSLDSLRTLAERAEAEMGPIDVLVNNAGVEQVCDFEAMPFDDLERIVTTNLLGLMRLTRLVLPSMVRRRSGHVCNIASLAGLNPVPHNTAYSTSKYGVVGFSRALRGEMADHDVEVSVVCPGFVDGGMFSEWGREPPKGFAAVSSPDVADAVLRAVENNDPVVTVTKGVARIAHVIGAMSPAFADATAEHTGMLAFFRDQARRNAERKG